MALFATLPVVLAADMVQIIIGAIVFIIYIVGQLASLRGDAKAEPKRPRRQPAPDPRRDEPVLLADEQQAAPRRQVPDQAESLRNEIEDFVRRAQGKPPQQKPPQAKPKRQRPPKRLSKQQRPQPTAPAPTLRTEGVAEHTSRHIDSSKLGEHAEHLGSQLGQTDERMESRLHEKFDHQVGSLKHRKTSAEKKKPQEDVAAEIAAMLSRPEGVRQLIIANEILRRPEW